MSTPIQAWKFDPRPAVNPKASAAEWAWVVDWVTQQGLTGKCYAVRTMDLEGEYVSVQFDVFDGQTTKRDNDVRNL